MTIKEIRRIAAIAHIGRMSHSSRRDSKGRHMPLRYSVAEMAVYQRSERHAEALGYTVAELVAP